MPIRNPISQHCQSTHLILPFAFIRIRHGFESIVISDESGRDDFEKIGEFGGDEGDGLFLDS